LPREVKADAKATIHLKYSNFPCFLGAEEMFKTVRDVDLERDVKFHPHTKMPVEILGRPIMEVGLPDWRLCYIETFSREKREDIRIVLYRLKQEKGIGKIVMITPMRIYFEL